MITPWGMNGSWKPCATHSPNERENLKPVCGSYPIGGKPDQHRPPEKMAACPKKAWISLPPQQPG